MHTAEDRLKFAMMAAALDPTPEALARATSIPLERARAVFQLSRELPQAMTDLAMASHLLRVRTFFMVTGQGVPMVDGSMTEREVAAVEVASSLEGEKFDRWITRGRRIAEW